MHAYFHLPHGRRLARQLLFCELIFPAFVVHGMLLDWMPQSWPLMVFKNLNLEGWCIPSFLSLLFLFLVWFFQLLMCLVLALKHLKLSVMSCLTLKVAQPSPGVAPSTSTAVVVEPSLLTKGTSFSPSQLLHNSDPSPWDGAFLSQAPGVRIRLCPGAIMPGF